ncbi:unnamed protein product [Rotaria sordida]|uniref:Protein kinase domain-containing protein n=1 Tax=Rotaria sordida TaxID=392033 RepID=A0A813NCW5_9BILA|nr:unnamed protein product [Rotaria sordida]
MVSIIKTLTTNNIVHMDLKLDNFILFERTLKIIDLVYQKYWQDCCVHGRPYGSKADVWSLGAIVYYMPYGKPSKYNPRAANPPHG